MSTLFGQLDDDHHEAAEEAGLTPLPLDPSFSSRRPHGSLASSWSAVAPRAPSSSSLATSAPQSQSHTTRINGDRHRDGGEDDNAAGHHVDDPHDSLSPILRAALPYLVHHGRARASTTRQAEGDHHDDADEASQTLSRLRASLRHDAVAELERLIDVLPRELLSALFGDARDAGAGTTTPAQRSRVAKVRRRRRACLRRAVDSGVGGSTSGLVREEVVELETARRRLPRLYRAMVGDDEDEDDDDGDQGGGPDEGGSVRGAGRDALWDGRGTAHRGGEGAPPRPQPSAGGGNGSPARTTPTALRGVTRPEELVASTSSEAARRLVEVLRRGAGVDAAEGRGDEEDTSRVGAAARGNGVGVGVDGVQVRDDGTGGGSGRHELEGTGGARRSFEPVHPSRLMEVGRLRRAMRDADREEEREARRAEEAVADMAEEEVDEDEDEPKENGDGRRRNGEIQLHRRRRQGHSHAEKPGREAFVEEVRRRFVEGDPTLPAHVYECDFDDELDFDDRRGVLPTAIDGDGGDGGGGAANSTTASARGTGETQSSSGATTATMTMAGRPRMPGWSEEDAWFDDEEPS